MPSGGARPGTGGERVGAGRKPKGKRPLVLFQVKTDERVKAAFELAYKEANDELTKGEFLELVLRNSPVLKKAFITLSEPY